MPCLEACLEVTRMRKVILYFYTKYKGDFMSIFNAIKNKEIIPSEELEKVVDDTSLITIIDDDYPDELKEQYMPPFVIKREDK